MAEGFDNGDDMDLPVGEEAVNRLIRENRHLFSDGHCKVCSAVLISESQKLAHYQSRKHASKYRRYLTIHQGDGLTPAKRRADGALDIGDETDRNKCCPVCNMTFSSPVVATSHYEGKTHAKNLKLKIQGGVKEGIPLPKKPRLTPPAPDTTKKTGTADRSDPEKFCQLCNATFNNPHMAQQHYAGKKHKKQETKSKLMTIYTSCGNTLPQSTPLKPLTPGSASTGNGFTCDTCNIVVNSIAQYEAHISGTKHKNNLMSNVTAPVNKFPSSYSTGPESPRGSYPRVSSSANQFSSAGFYSAPPGSPPPKKPCLTPPAPDTTKKTGTGDQSDPEKFCQLCNATFNNPHMAQQHYVGKKHKKQETKSKLMTIYTSCGSTLPQSTPLTPLTPCSASTGNGFTCDTCNIVVNSIAQYEAHISGMAHLKV
ncbi:zinc finger protein 346 [Pyxicephalus adspersus]|uniref:zinc finger protein 346 n=1 Tax=Pyxicephalus adspersus TaxID=30357 RepID=UPI003B5B5C83